MLTFDFSFYLLLSVLVSQRQLTTMGEIYMKFLDETAELPCASSANSNHRINHSSSSAVVWLGPSTKMVVGGNVAKNESYGDHDHRLSIKNDGALVISSLRITDAGKYVCMSLLEDPSRPKVLAEHELPYIIVRKDHVKSFYAALAIAGTFFVTVTTLYLLSEYKSGTFGRSGERSSDDSVGGQNRCTETVSKRVAKTDLISSTKNRPTRAYVNSTIDVTDSHL